MTSARRPASRPTQATPAAGAVAQSSAPLERRAAERDAWYSFGVVPGVPPAFSSRPCSLTLLNAPCTLHPQPFYLHAREERRHVGDMLHLWTLCLFLTLSFVRPACAKSFIFFVATNGNDGWSGRLEKPGRDGRDGPLATLPVALKAARSARQSSKQTSDRATIFLRGGTYSVAQPIVLGPGDSGSG